MNPLPIREDHYFFGILFLEIVYFRFFLHHLQLPNFYSSKSHFSPPFSYEIGESILDIFDFLCFRRNKVKTMLE